MGHSFESNIPIYIQVMDDIKRKIARGVYKPADRIESVRELAQFYGVNPNTVQRALQELEREGLLHAERTSGRFITDSPDLINLCVSQLAQEIAQSYINQIQSIGMSVEQGILLLQEEAMKRGIK